MKEKANKAFHFSRTFFIFYAPEKMCPFNWISAKNGKSKTQGDT